MTKPRQLEDTSSRIIAYSDWRRGWGDGAYCCDIDFVEFRYRDDRPELACLIETTVADKMPMTQALKVEVLRRLRTGHGNFLASLARHLGVPAYVVLMNSEATELHVLNLTRHLWSDEPKWHQTGREDFQDKIMNHPTVTL